MPECGGVDGRDGVLQVTWFQHPRVEHEGVEIWEGDHRSAGSDADATPNANATPVQIALRTAGRIGTETEGLPMECERRQIRNGAQHCAERAKIDHDPEGPRIVVVPSQRQRGQSRKVLRRAGVYTPQVSCQRKVLRVEGFKRGWGKRLTCGVRL